MTDARTGGDGVLWIVATPIGNLEDITLRALRALREADVVLAEDTRRTRSLLRALSIDKEHVERLDDHVVRHKLPDLLARLAGGARIALVSDAGTPVVSDPGAVLVRAAADAGVRVEAVPGPSAVLTALVVSGIASHGFRFVGFLPREGPERQRAIASIARDELPTVLFESPGRTHDTLVELAASCGSAREAAVGRELTKMYEEVMRGALGALAVQTADRVLGEVTLVVAGASAAGTAEENTEEALDSALDSAMAAGMKPSDAAREVAKAMGMKRAEVYARVLARAGRKPPG
ncbi:MAG: 16S rRNA (cytidine(1402)-2'-O)-methyltransferase [Deltaproteobacteria bacterium]